MNKRNILVYKDFRISSAKVSFQCTNFSGQNLVSQCKCTNIFRVSVSFSALKKLVRDSCSDHHQNTTTRSRGFHFFEVILEATLFNNNRKEKVEPVDLAAIVDGSKWEMQRGGGGGGKKAHALCSRNFQSVKLKLEFVEV